MSTTLHEAIIESLAQVVGDRELNEEQFDRLVETTITKSVPKIAADMLKVLRRNSRAMLKDEASARSRFVARNLRRWQRPIAELEIMLRIAEEAGGELIVEWNEGEQSDPYMFAALNHLHVKALLTCREILCLIANGFADGALARWRTLHEFSVFARFIGSADELTARRFVASFDFKARKAARQLNKFAERANLEKFSDEDLKELDRICDAHAAELGSGLGDEYGWTRPRLAAKRLEDLETETGLDHWRPRYRWASQNVHGGFRPPLASLGLSEARKEGHLIGPSNSGMVDPLQMAAISLSIVCMEFLAHWPNIDRLVVVEILSRLSSGVGPLAFKVERESALKAAKISRA